MFMTSKSGPVQGLFQTAQAEGIVSKAALTALNLGDIGADINAALGVSIDDVKASEVTLFSANIDDSSSIPQAHNTDLIRDGANLVLDALTKTKQKDGILAMLQYFNRGLLYPYTMVEQAPRLDSQNYRPQGGTPLYDSTITMLGAVLAKSQDFQGNGIPCRTVSVIVSDGGDNRGLSGAERVKKIVEDMLRQETHIIAFVGVDDGYTDFKEVAKAMGILDQWILTPKNSPSDIRRAFQMISQSATRMSQASGATFSQAAMGGFGTP